MSSMKPIPTTRHERPDPREREELIREIIRKVRMLDVKQLQRIAWNLQRKWGV